TCRRKVALPALRRRDRRGDERDRCFTAKDARGGHAMLPPLPWLRTDQRVRTRTPSCERLASPARSAAPGRLGQPDLFARPQARAMGTATNFVASPDFTRINTMRLALPRASAKALRTSVGVETVLPPTSRMMSPVLKPCSAAGP